MKQSGGGRLEKSEGRRNLRYFLGLRTYSSLGQRDRSKDLKTKRDVNFVTLTSNIYAKTYISDD